MRRLVTAILRPYFASTCLMINSRPTHYTVPARFLAVLALLFMLCVQVLEVSHNHPASDPVSSCFLCHTGTAAVLPTSVPGVPVIVATGILLVLLYTQAIIPLVLRANLTRGPPLNS